MINNGGGGFTAICTRYIWVFLHFFQGIGDSGQGFWNFVLFCLLTSEVRVTIKQSFCSPPGRERYDSLSSNASGESTGSVNDGEPRRLIPSITAEIRDQYNKERTALYHKQFSNYDSTSLLGHESGDFET
jgi:hypothetical protein